MKEQDFQKKIQKDLEQKGWYVIKLIKTNKNGIPDLVALKHNKVYFLECKTPKGKLSKLQSYRLEELKKLGFEVAVSYGYDIKEFV